MGGSLFVVVPITLFWAVIGIVVPFFIRGRERGTIRCCLMLTAFTCWLFWLCCYMAQMNPLIGPRLHSIKIWIMKREWGGAHS